MRLRTIAVLISATLLACTSERPASVETGAGYQSMEAWNGEALMRQPVAARAALAEARVVADASGDLPPVTAAYLDATMVIRTANASVQVDSLEPAVALVRELAARLGGYVANTEVHVGKNQLRSAALAVKIPSQRFDEALSGLTPIGKLESVSVNAEDVGEQFVDVTARMENAKRLERRLIELLANRTGKLKDVLDVEQTLARVREEIERYEGRIRYLRAHAATSTLSIYIHEPIPVVGTAGRSVLGDAARQAWRNFVVLISLAVQSLGVVVPLGAVAIGAWIVTRRWRLARQRVA